MARRKKKLTMEVGGVYENKFGKKVKIKEKKGVVYFDVDGHKYGHSGVSIGKDRTWDLDTRIDE